MRPVETQTDVARAVVALVAVVLAAIALIVLVGVAVARVAPDIGGDDIVEPDDDTRAYPDAAALMAAIGCTDAVAVPAFEGSGPSIRSYAQPTAYSCPSTHTLALVYVDADDRLTAEDDGDVEDRACAEVAVETPATTTTVVPAETAPAEPTVAPPTPAPTTVAPTTTTLVDTVFGLVRGPNWILATSDGEAAAAALQSRLGGVLFTKTCEAPEE
jgi:hypothetical protein